MLAGARELERLLFEEQFEKLLERLAQTWVAEGFEGPPLWGLDSRQLCAFFDEHGVHGENQSVVFRAVVERAGEKLSSHMERVSTRSRH